MIARQAVCRCCCGGRATTHRLADGTRLRDSLCGMLATSGVLHKLRVPFSYINNCRIDIAQFEAGVDRFVRSVRVVKTLKTMKIGQLGQRIDFFWSTIIAEAEISERFGIQVWPIDLVETLRAVRRRTEDHRAAYRCELAEFQRWVSSTTIGRKTISSTTSPCVTSCWNWPTPQAGRLRSAEFQLDS